MPGLTLLIHLYYPGSWPLLEDRCRAVLRKASRIIVTACHDDVLDEIQPPKKDNTLVRLKVPNKGKDIGGKLAAFSYYMNFCEKTEYIALLHDKVSPQSINADYWSQQLYGLFSKEGLHKALRLLEQDRLVGIVGAKTFLKNEFMPSEGTFTTTNHQLLMEMIRDYRLHGRIYDFIAGTIFIGRSRIFEQFFSAHSPLDARAKLETGNVLDLAAGTYTHSWERLLCFLAEDQGLTIKGI
ncbi:rhamnan synthesis F family protein [Flavitalea sp. BT771]|uniref:rhamnan synthesis F family protein n=1 Tax=Flavitalea sp. BT771 TaxID=3063329 RepID=UPI0026E48732|nr:rhamnan synthesis F family protein [Flavitalea sp. BT771]MDO6432589.1 rhamnan synthesis F family protein [Flavitalea sp. BT771]MDV6222135.1 rhamnan synthesis F family protein [Flavitalea sp. BT771]